MNERPTSPSSEDFAESDTLVLSSQPKSDQASFAHEYSAQSTCKKRPRIKVVVLCILLVLTGTLLFINYQTGALWSGRGSCTVLPNQTFNIPKNIWVYRTSASKGENYEKLKRSNLQFANQSHYTVQQINPDNFKHYISANMSEWLSKAFWNFDSYIQQKASQEQLKMLKPLIEKMKTRIMTLHVLEAKGGIMMDEEFSLTEDLNWLEQIDTNPYVSRLERFWPTEVVGFIEPRISSEKKKFLTDEPTHAPFKHIRLQPCLHPVFIAAVKKAQFISKLCASFRTELKNGNNLAQHLLEPGYSSEPVLQFLLVSKSLIGKLQESEKQTGVLAIDRYGLSFINMFYGPRKLNNQLTTNNQTVRFNYCADLPLVQLEEMFGRFRYGSLPLESYELSYFFRGQRRVMNGSLMHHLFPGLSSQLVYPNLEVSVTNQSAPFFDDYPKKVWTIWPTGYESAPITNKLSLAIMKKRFQPLNYTVTLVTLENAKQYLDSELVDELVRIVNNKNFKRYPPTMSDLLRLALLVEHGGIYMDMGTLLQKDVEWIRNIARLPSHLVLNRFQQVPKILSTYTFMMPSPPFWSINPQTKTKEAWLMNYENCFFVVDKGNQFLAKVLKKYMEMLEASTEKLVGYVAQTQLQQYSLVSDDLTYLLQTQMIYSVLSEKQIELSKNQSKRWINSPHYYGFWHIFGPDGFAKFWKNYNHLDDLNSQPSSYFMEYSSDYVYGLLGEPKIPVIKIIGDETRALSKVLEEYSQRNTVVSDQMHPQSPLKKLMDEFGFKIVKQGKVLKLVETTQ